jgi:predicted component of type VI protein secretion system
MTESTALNRELPLNPDSLTLELYYHNASTVVTAEQTPFVMGRENVELDLTVNCEFSSRQHCAIEFHDGKFILKDFSLNGTFVQLNRSQTFRVHNETTPLIGNGCFKLGATMTADDPERILFRVKKSTKKA